MPGGGQRISVAGPGGLLIDAEIAAAWPVQRDQRGHRAGLPGRRRGRRRRRPRPAFARAWSCPAGWSGWTPGSGSWRWSTTRTSRPPSRRCLMPSGRMSPGADRGDRRRRRSRPGKRPMMGANAAERAELVIVTDDNPQVRGPGGDPVGTGGAARSPPDTRSSVEVGDRREAIRTAVARGPHRRRGGDRRQGPRAGPGDRRSGAPVLRPGRAARPRWPPWRTSHR